MSQVTPKLDNNTNDKLGQYANKWIASEIPTFVAIWGNGQSIENKVTATLELQSLGARAYALLIQGFMDYAPTDEDKAEHAIASEALLELDKVDPDLVLLEKLGKAKNASAKLKVLRTQDAYLAELASERATAHSVITRTTCGAQLASQIAFQQGMQYGELRDGSTANGSSGNKNEKLVPGVYETTLGKLVFRICWESRSAWYAYSVSEGIASEIASYDALAPQINNEKRTPFVSSPTRARKVCKAWLAYQGFRGEKAVIAAFTAERRAFDALSAGNPTIKNWHLVDNMPTAWREAVNKGKGKLPTETVTETG